MRPDLMIYSFGEILGDGLLKLPALAAARSAFPEHRIVWAVASGETIYETGLKALAAPLLDEVLKPRPGGDAPLDLLTPKPFGGRKFDVVIDTQSQLAPAAFAKRAAKRRFVSAAAGFALSDVRPQAPWPQGLTDQVCALIGLAAGREVAPAPLRIADPELLAAAAHLLPEGPRYVGLAPGAGGKDKIWPLTGYLAVAAHVAAHGAVPVFFLGPQEAAWVDEVRRAAPSALMPEWDRTDPLRHVKGPLLAVAMASRLAAAVANDSGIGHALAVGGAPLVSLQQSARKAAKFRPAAARLEIVIAESFGAGMEAIPVEAVIAALRRLR